MRLDPTLATWLPLGASKAILDYESLAVPPVLLGGGRSTRTVPRFPGRHKGFALLYLSANVSMGNDVATSDSL